ncbi:hypothetical protein CIWKM_07_02810 [Citrobacter werkmanii NBRC 105721]|nr:hypothetical protein CIWKM_07_02810 [Citrobacter werkmanii NBRC 105721]
MRNGQQTLSCDFLQRCIICSDLYYLLSITEECMKEGYYWIQHIGVVQVAYYTNDTVDDLETGKIITDVWHLTRGDDICHN